MPPATTCLQQDVLHAHLQPKERGRAGRCDELLRPRRFGAVEKRLLTKLDEAERVTIMGRAQQNHSEARRGFTVGISHDIGWSILDAGEPDG